MRDSKWRIRRLESARSYLRQVLDTYDTNQQVCGECGLRHYRDFGESQSHSRMQGVLQKIEALIQYEHDNTELSNARAKEHQHGTQSTDRDGYDRD